MPRGPHALIVEDELIVGMALQAQLADLGFTSFAFASTPRLALEQALQHCPDLLTIDVGLMAGDGNEAVRAIEAECGKVPTLFITGSPQAVAARKGAVVLSKPVGRAELARAVEQLGGLPRERREDGRDQGASAAISGA